MTPAHLSQIHTASFAPDRGWSAVEFSNLLDQPYTSLFTREYGFALARTLAGESELLTLAVTPDHQGKGIGSALLKDWLGAAQADIAYLEVAADNTAAITLYERAGFEVTGHRRGYYARPGTHNVDAIVMSLALTQGHQSR